MSLSDERKRLIGTNTSYYIPIAGADSIEKLEIEKDKEKEVNNKMVISPSGSSMIVFASLIVFVILLIIASNVPSPNLEESPLPRLNDSGLRWGVAGLGRITHDFTAALKATGANVTAGLLRHAHSSYI
jgi:hypothetical protein